MRTRYHACLFGAECHCLRAPAPGTMAGAAQTALLIQRTRPACAALGVFVTVCARPCADRHRPAAGEHDAGGRWRGVRPARRGAVGGRRALLAGAPRGRVCLARTGSRGAACMREASQSRSFLRPAGRQALLVVRGFAGKYMIACAEVRLPPPVFFLNPGARRAAAPSEADPTLSCAGARPGQPERHQPQRPHHQHQQPAPGPALAAERRRRAAPGRQLDRARGVPAAPRPAGAPASLTLS